MSRIQVLSPNLANQIAAGEVVERPASVVKELVENSVDAGATHITIEIENGGIDCIRVTDNGCGIHAEDCEKAFLRHATSKISSQEDLSRIQTLGFRGEALASIASVSDVTLKTRTADSESGTLLRIDNGKITDRKPYACMEGTSAEVRNLFAKVPARLKFLKNARTEAGYIGDYVLRMILAMPQISFQFNNNGKTVYRTYGDGQLLHAIFAVYGSSYLGELKEVTFDDGYMRISGYIGTAQLARPNHMQQSVFLNDRYIKNIKIADAVQRAYDTRLLVGRFPFFVLNIKISSAEVDVNVHPTKMEVRFADERRVCNSVYEACYRTLERLDHHDISAEKEDFRRDIIEKSQETAASQPWESTDAAVETNEKESFGKSTDIIFTGYDIAPEKNTVFVREETSPVTDVSPNPFRFTGFSAENSQLPLYRIHVDTSDKSEGAEPSEDVEKNAPFGQTEFRIVGSFFGGYWLVEEKERVILVDQHAAHERILFEELKQRTFKQISQALLIPKEIPLSPREETALEEYREDFTEFGFDFDFTGNHTILLKTVPVVRGTMLSEDSIFDAINIINDNGSFREIDFVKTSIMQASCKHAVKVTEQISREEIQKLMEMLASGEIPLTCPHGRPVLTIVSKKDIEKLFKRIV